jgi:hypothetical protein
VYKTVQENLWKVRFLSIRALQEQHVTMNTAIETVLTELLEYEEPLARELCKHLHRAMLITIEYMRLLENSDTTFNKAEQTLMQMPLRDYIASLPTEAQDLIPNVHASLGIDMCMVALVILYDEQQYNMQLMVIEEARIKELVRFAHLQVSEYERYMRINFGIRLPVTNAEQQEWQDFVGSTAGMFTDFPLERPEQKAWTRREEMF